MANSNTEIILDRAVRRAFPEVTEELVSMQLGTSRLHEIIKEYLKIDAAVEVSAPGTEYPVAKFTDRGARIPYAPVFYVLRSPKEFKYSQPGRLLQEIAACRNCLGDFIVKQMRPLPQGIPNLELEATIVGDNIPEDSLPPTADIDVRITGGPVGEGLYATEKQVYQRLFNLSLLTPAEIHRRYIEAIKMGMMLRLNPDEESGTSLLTSSERGPLLLHMYSIRKMVELYSDRPLDIRSYSPDTHKSSSKHRKSLLIKGLWDTLFSPAYYAEIIKKANKYIQKMLQPDPNSFLSDPIHLKGVLIEPNESGDDRQYRVH